MNSLHFSFWVFGSTILANLRWAAAISIERPATSIANRRLLSSACNVIEVVAVKCDIPRFDAVLCKASRYVPSIHSDEHVHRLPSLAFPLSQAKTGCNCPPILFTTLSGNSLS